MDIESSDSMSDPVSSVGEAPYARGPAPPVHYADEIAGLSTAGRGRPVTLHWYADESPCLSTAGRGQPVTLHWYADESPDLSL